MAGPCRKLHNDKLPNFRSSPNICGDQINADTMGCAGGRHGRDDKCLSMKLDMSNLSEEVTSTF
jgi:hypothetical protein